jgi:CheY-like chemotaxis protein
MANPTIRVADDDEMVGEVLSRQLTAKGYAVRSAADGVEAWELFQRQACEILLTDLDMPRMTGQRLLTYDLVAPTYTLLNSIDTLINLIKDGDAAKALFLSEKQSVHPHEFGRTHRF